MIVVCLGAAMTCTSCTILENMMPRHREAERKVAELRVLQLSVMRYADEYAGRVAESAEKYQRSARTPEDRLRAQNWRQSQSTAAYAIGSGVDAITNALDCVVFATLSRMVIEDVWTQTAAPERVDPLLETHRDLEAKAWSLVEPSLTDAQENQLREIISAWRREHPQVQAVGYIHFAEFAKAIGLPRPGNAIASENLFSLLGIDPFSGLDPAVRELNQTRELAERTIFYLQRAPHLLGMEVERLVYQMTVMPETKTLLSDLDRASLVGSAADRFSKELPEVIAGERKALVAQLTAELQHSSRSMQTLSQDVRATLDSATETAKAMEAMIAAANALTARLKPEEKSPDTSNGRSSFDVDEYRELLSQLSVTAGNLSELLQKTDAAIPLMRRATQDVSTVANDLLDRSFRQLLILIAVAIIGSLFAALLYRVLVERFIVRRA